MQADYCAMSSGTAAIDVTTSAAIMPKAAVYRVLAVACPVLLLGSGRLLFMERRTGVWWLATSTL
jgi:hypothetical protein